MKRRKKSRPGRREMIAALGLSPETRKRGDQYMATTSELWHSIKHGTRDRDIQARKRLG